MEQRTRYVYKVFDKLNEDSKIYIGSTFDIDKRWDEHKRRSNSIKLKKDMEEFGTQDFDIEILFSGSEDEAYEKEIELIRDLKPYYNNTGDIGGKFGGDKKGENNGRAILLYKDIIDICNRVTVNGEQACDVAKHYQISASIIYEIVNGNAWQHVLEAPRKQAGEVDNKGENNGWSKLKRQDIIYICNEVVINGIKVPEIAKEYPNITVTNIYDIVNGKAWKRVKEAPRRKAGEQDSIGENNGMAKLKEADIIDICVRIVEKGEDPISVAKDYPQTSVDYIYTIVNGRVWKHVKEAPRKKAKKIFSKEDVLFIREEAKDGKTPEEIRNEFSPNKEVRAVKKVIHGKSFPNYPGPIKGKDY